MYIYRPTSIEENLSKVQTDNLYIRLTLPRCVYLPGVDEKDIEIDVASEKDLVECAARHRPGHRQRGDEGGVECSPQRQRHRLRERERLQRSRFGSTQTPFVVK